MSDKESKDSGVKKMKYKGKSLTFSQWAEELGVSEWTLRSRHRLGWPVKRILSERTTREAREELLKKAYDFIVLYKGENGGNSPSIEEIATTCGTVLSNAKDLVDTLQERELIKVEPGQSRMIEVTGAKWIPPE